MTIPFSSLALFVFTPWFAAPPGAVQAGAAPAKDAPQADAPKKDPFDDGGPRGVRVRTAGAFEGYTLVAPLNSHQIHLVDLAGNVVHTWKTDRAPGGGTYLLDDGHLLRTVREEDNPRFHGGGIGGRIQELTWDGEVVWDFVLATAERTMHHDLCLLPNGHVLVIAWEYHSKDEARARGRDERALHEEGLWTDVLLEVRPTRPVGGEIVWTWRTWDHLVQDRDPKLSDFGALAENAGRIDINADHRYAPHEETAEERARREELERQMAATGYAGGAHDDFPPATPPKPGRKIEADWLHTNSVALLPVQDLILFSMPHLGEIAVIDHATTTEQAAGAKGGRRGHGGELLWRWGNPRNYGAGGAQDQQLFYQHQPSWIAGSTPGELRVLVFNNGQSRPGKEHSRVEELVLPFDPASGFARAAGRPFGPEKPVWSYADPDRFYAPFISGAERLPNGNTLICEGPKGRVFEVQPGGAIVWDYWSPLGGDVEPSPQGGKAPPRALFRAERFAPDHSAVRGRIAAAK